MELTRASAESFFRLETPGEDGKSAREKLESIEKATGNRPKELDVEPIPPAALDAFQLWQDISSGRSNNGNCVVSLSWLDIDAWSRMRGYKPTYTELALIRIFDAAFVNQSNQKKEN